ncbi:MAG: SUMF1/EgtB/PvdO family nonheme iron enzyme [Acidobacteria bacterium]|nr:SUMF1/EgtB/PvdO family nonheme iron enzyme [Acidobacteriota bacterium]
MLPIFRDAVRAATVLLLAWLIALCVSCKHAPELRRRGPDGLNYVSIEPGRFVMGSPPQDSRPHVLPAAAEVQLTNGFWITETEVTQAAFERLMGSNPSRFRADDQPVDSITWDEARLYCERVGGRLPTEAEWEYAARAGERDWKPGLEDRVAWHGGNSSGRTHAVRTKAPNEFGLYDMLGNVCEWTGTWYKSGVSGGVNPTGPASGPGHSLRGGEWNTPPDSIRFWENAWAPDADRLETVGFRCVLPSRGAG